MIQKTNDEEKLWSVISAYTMLMIEHSSNQLGRYDWSTMSLSTICTQNFILKNIRIFARVWIVWIIYLLLELFAAQIIPDRAIRSAHYSKCSSEKNFVKSSDSFLWIPLNQVNEQWTILFFSSSLSFGHTGDGESTSNHHSQRSKIQNSCTSNHLQRMEKNWMNIFKKLRRKRKKYPLKRKEHSTFESSTCQTK